MTVLAVGEVGRAAATGPRTTSSIHRDGRDSAVSRALQSRCRNAGAGQSADL